MSGTLGFFYGVGIYLVVLTLITFFALASYLCRTPRSHSLVAEEDGRYSVAIALGLDEATLGSFPTLLYSQAKTVSRTCCSICLSDYKETDVLRLLPDCGHDFHSKCIDPWLRICRSCPNCRTLLVPTPVRTPLAEVAPLATSLR